jgi:hypothetical protein
LIEWPQELTIKLGKLLSAIPRLGGMYEIAKSSCAFQIVQKTSDRVEAIASFSRKASNEVSHFLENVAESVVGILHPKEREP